MSVTVSQCQRMSAVKVLLYMRKQLVYLLGDDIFSVVYNTSFLQMTSAKLGEIAMKKFRTSNVEHLSIEEIRRFVDSFSLEIARYKKLNNYYLARNVVISEYEKTDKTAPNNHVVNAYAKYITDVLTGYFVGQPIAYTAKDGGERLLELLTDIYNYNDEQAENMALAKGASINGIAYELMYADSDSNIRFANVPASEMFVVYDMSIEDNICHAVRVYSYGSCYSEQRYVQVYDSTTVRTFDYNGGMVLLSEEPHYWGDVPVIVYENNREGLGDFEPVISLIDAYDKLQSNTLNDMEQFTDAYLKLRNMSGTTADDLAMMRKQRAILLDDDGEADWLVKSVNDAWVENYKNRINADIHKFSFTPDLTDEQFAGSASGVALRYKLMGMEQIRATKERGFKKGLQRRIELICNRLALTNSVEDWRTIDMKFNNTLPQNLLELSQIVGNLSPYLSNETLLSLLYFVDDPQAEIERKEAEQDEQAAKNYASMMALADTSTNEGVDNDES